MRIVFLGPPGAGKGTQAKLLSKDAGLAHISTGEMLRSAVAAGTPLGTRVKGIMDAGQLVPDDLIVELISERISQSDCARGYILDGFPRTVPQAEALERMLMERGVTLSGIIFFAPSEADLAARLAHRRGAESRSDDSADAQLERLRVYEQQTAPLVEFYQKKQMLSRVDASGSIDEVYSRLKKTLAAI